MNFIKKFLDLLFPKKLKCIFCGRDIPDFDKQPYCEDCAKEEFFNNGKYRCKCCDTPLPIDEGYCYHCKKDHKDFDKALSPFIYVGAVRKTVLKFKSNNGKYLAEPMGKLMAERVKDAGLDFDIIVPTPLSAKSFKKRGYNQSELLANEMGKLLDKPVRTDILLKAKETQHQKELGFSDRQKNLKGAFKIEHSKDIEDLNILLVDDIMTTGATSNQCAKALKKYCGSVYVVVFARRDLNHKDKPTFKLKNLFKSKKRFKK